MSVLSHTAAVEQIMWSQQDVLVSTALLTETAKHRSI